MKGCKYLVFLLVFLAGIYLSYAINVSLELPSNSEVIVNNKNVTFKCSADNDPVNITLYHDASGTLEVNQTNFTLSNGVAYFSINGFEEGIYRWGCLAASDTATGDSGDAYSFEIVININTPYSTVIPNLSFVEDNVYSGLNLSVYFSDDDNDNLSYSATSSSNYAVSFSGALASITPSANFSGLTTIQFTATDGVNQNTSNTITLNITAVKDPPHLKTNIPVLNWTSGNTKEINLGDYFGDVDGDSLTYSHSNVSDINITIESDSDVIFKAIGNFTGKRYVVFSASDGNLIVKSNNITLNVNSAVNVTQTLNLTQTINNNAPVISSYIPVNADVSIDEGKSQVFSIVKSDSDNDSLIVEWLLDGVKIEGETSDSYTYSSKKGDLGGADWVAYDVQVVVSDGMLTVSRSWRLVVNRAERVTLICGDGKISIGENCENCPDDVKCGRGKKCVSGVCQESKGWIIYLLLIVMLVGIIAVVVFYSFKKGKFKTGGLFKKKEKIDLFKKKEKPVDFKEEIKPKVEVVVKEGDVLSRIKVGGEQKVSLGPLEGFISKALKEGWTEDRIKRALLKKGWQLKQVDEAYNKVKK